MQDKWSFLLIFIMWLTSSITFHATVFTMALEFSSQNPNEDFFKLSQPKVSAISKSAATFLGVIESISAFSQMVYYRNFMDGLIIYHILYDNDPLGFIFSIVIKCIWEKRFTNYAG